MFGLSKSTLKYPQKKNLFFLLLPQIYLLGLKWICPLAHKFSWWLCLVFECRRTNHPSFQRKYESSGTRTSEFAQNRAVTVIWLLILRKRTFHAFACTDENRIPRALVRRWRIRFPVSLFKAIRTLSGGTGVINRICEHRISDHDGVQQFHVGQREKRIHNLFDCKFNSRQAGLLIHVIDCGAMAVGTGNDVIQTKQLGSGRSIPQEISTLEYTLEKKNRKHRLIMHPGAHSTPRHLSIVTLYEHRYIGCIHTVSSSVGWVFCSVELQGNSTALELEEGGLGETGSGVESLELEEGCGFGDMVWLELLELKSTGVP